MEQNLAEQISRAALDCGFERCGIVPLDELEGFSERLREREEKVPSSKKFYHFPHGLDKTRERFPWAKAMVICSFWYGKYRYPAQLQGRYAKDFFLKPEGHMGRGYDRAEFERRLTQLGVRFEGGEQFLYYSVGPLRYAAARAGLGIVRKNNFFYTEKGSHNLLLGYVIDRECSLVHTSECRPCPAGCDLCQRACKTRALSAPYTFSPYQCVSFWTTFGRGEVPAFLREEMFEEWICGCDNCQDACPFNRTHDWSVGEPIPELEELAEQLTPKRAAEQSDEFLISHVISRTDNHLTPADAPVLRKNARRAAGFGERKPKKQEE